MGKGLSKNHCARNLAIFAGCVFLWLIADRVTKMAIDGNHAVGEVIVDNVLGLFRFDLVHNTGAAWGSFAGSTLVLAGVSLLICVGVVVFAFLERQKGSVVEMVGLALVFAGGIGNFIDRVFYGYVVDFITPTFIDFPTFNIADIGVTCGIVLVVITLVIQIIAEKKERPES